MLEIIKSKEMLVFVLGLSILFFYDGLKQEQIEEEYNSPLVIYHIDDDMQQYTINND